MAAVSYQNGAAPRRPVPVPLDRLSLLVSLLLVGLTVSLLLDLPVRAIEFTFLGSRATLVFSGAWLFALLLTALTAAGVEAIVRSHPHVLLSETRYTAILWVLPCILTLAASLIVPGLPLSRPYAFGVVLITGILLTVVILGEYYTIDSYDPAYSFARLGLNLATYLTALLIYITVYGLKVRTILSAPVTAVLSGLLALELLRGSESDVRRTWLYATAVGLAMGESTWAINYWNSSVLAGSVTLLLLFYVFTGIVQQFLWGRLNWRMMLEFVLVVAVVWLLIWTRG